MPTHGHKPDALADGTVRRRRVTRPNDIYQPFKPFQGASSYLQVNIYANKLCRPTTELLIWPKAQSASSQTGALLFLGWILGI